MLTKSITLNNRVFVVRPQTVAVIKDMRSVRFGHIQEMLVEFFNRMDDVLSDEYALAISVYFPNSNAPHARQSRCAADVRKYNNADFACMEGAKPTKPIRHLDGGTRKTKRDVAAEAKALEALDALDDES